MPYQQRHPKIAKLRRLRMPATTANELAAAHPKFVPIVAQLEKEIGANFLSISAGHPIQAAGCTIRALPKESHSRTSGLVSLELVRNKKVRHPLPFDMHIKVTPRSHAEKTFIAGHKFMQDFLRTHERNTVEVHGQTYTIEHLAPITHTQKVDLGAEYAASHKGRIVLVTLVATPILRKQAISEMPAGAQKLELIEALRKAMRGIEEYAEKNRFFLHTAKLGEKNAMFLPPNHIVLTSAEGHYFQ